MFKLEIYRQYWMLFSLAAGGIVMLATILWYLAVWRERGIETRAQLEITGFRSFAQWLQLAFPWILILTILGTFIFAIVYPQYRAIDPPNW